MYVKMMDGDPAPESVAGVFRVWQQVQGFNVFNAKSGEVKLPHHFKLTLDFEDGHSLTCDVTGEVYVLNDQGKTIETFSPNPGRTPGRVPRARRDRSDPEGGIPGRG